MSAEGPCANGCGRHCRDGDGNTWVCTPEGTRVNCGALFCDHCQIAGYGCPKHPGLNHGVPRWDDMLRNMGAFLEQMGTHMTEGDVELKLLPGGGLRIVKPSVVRPATGYPFKLYAKV